MLKSLSGFFIDLSAGCNPSVDEMIRNRQGLAILRRVDDLQSMKSPSGIDEPSHAKISMTYDLYGHLFDDPDADREAMKKIEAAVAAA